MDLRTWLTEIHSNASVTLHLNTIIRHYGLWTEHLIQPVCRKIITFQNSSQL